MLFVVVELVDVLPRRGVRKATVFRILLAKHFVGDATNVFPACCLGQAADASCPHPGLLVIKTVDVPPRRCVGQASDLGVTFEALGHVADGGAVLVVGCRCQRYKGHADEGKDQMNDTHGSSPGSAGEAVLLNTQIH